jgi:hypothetical protein|eukprot:COSAG01_NODE_19026_length_1035_cov_1.863248_2_plen_96_part_00
MPPHRVGPVGPAALLLHCCCRVLHAASGPALLSARLCLWSVGAEGCMVARAECMVARDECMVGGSAVLRRFLWSMLRTAGVADQVSGYGTLFRDH